jgi:putative chitinase
MYDITGDRPAKARELGNTNPGDGAKFCGRGYLQLTGRSNYRRATSRLRDLGYLTGDQDLEVTPDLAMQPDIAAAILFVGTREGWFTGHKLSQYFGAGKTDWTGARRIINGQDRAGEIGAHAKAFQTALVKADHLPGGVATALPVSPVTTKPLPPLAPAAPRPCEPALPVSTTPEPPKTLFAAIRRALTGK